MRHLLVLVAGITLATSSAWGYHTHIFVHGYSGGGSRESCEQKYYCSYWGTNVQFQVAADKPQGPDIVDQWGVPYWQSGRDPWMGTYASNVNVGWHTGYGWDWYGWGNGGMTPTLHVLYWWCGKHTGNTCTVTCHSTGCPIVGKLLASGWSQHLNVLSVVAGGSAEGGTELVDGTFGITQLVGILGQLVDYVSDYNIGPGWNVNAGLLGVGYVRASYNHHAPGTVPWIHHAGYNGSALTSWVLNGQDDGVVAHHSSCGYTFPFQANECSNDYYWTTCWWGPCTKTAPRWNGHTRTENAGRTGYNHTHDWLKSNYGPTHYSW